MHEELEKPKKKPAKGRGKKKTQATSKKGKYPVVEKESVEKPQNGEQ